VLLDAARVQAGEVLLESRQPPRSYVHLDPMLEIKSNDEFYKNAQSVLVIMSSAELSRTLLTGQFYTRLLVWPSGKTIFYWFRGSTKARGADTSVDEKGRT